MTDRVQNHDFGLIYMGSAEDLYCAECNATFCAEQNMRKHWRQCHERRRVP